MLSSPQQLAHEIQNMAPEKRVIFVHPNYKPQHLVLNPLRSDALYVRFSGEALTNEELLSQLRAAQAAQTMIVSPNGGGGVIWCDECDRAGAEALAGFIRAAIPLFPNMRLVLLSRVLPTGLLDDPDIRQQAAFLPTDADSMLWDYATMPDQTVLEVRAFGSGRVHLDGKPISSWDGALPRSLFFYLVDRAMVTRAEIFETFWPNLNTREATNVFHVTKRKISEVLGTELTVYGSGFYHISPKIHLSYDVSLFNQLVQDSDSPNADTTALKQALALYRGDYLTSISMDWVVKRRAAIQQATCDGFVALAKFHERDGHQHEALDAYLRAARIKPEREDTTLAIMRLYRQLALPQDALQVYERLEKALQNGLKVRPSPQIQQLAEEIRAEIA